MTMQQAYLKAMGITTWVRRDMPDVAVAEDLNITESSEQKSEIQPAQNMGKPTTRLMVGGGNGSCLLICRSAEPINGRFASDITRALGASDQAPVWSWPDNSESALPIEQAVSEKLITAVVIFGQELAQQVLGDATIDCVSAAKVHIAPELDINGMPAPHSRSLWNQLCEAVI